MIQTETRLKVADNSGAKGCFGSEEGKRNRRRNAVFNSSRFCNSHV